jgi:hypothetical protein
VVRINEKPRKSTVATVSPVTHRFVVLFQSHGSFQRAAEVFSPVASAVWLGRRWVAIAALLVIFVGSGYLELLTTLYFLVVFLGIGSGWILRRDDLARGLGSEHQADLPDLCGREVDRAQEVALPAPLADTVDRGCVHPRDAISASSSPRCHPYSSCRRSQIPVTLLSQRYLPNFLRPE